MLETNRPTGIGLRTCGYIHFSVNFRSVAQIIKKYGLIFLKGGINVSKRRNM